MKLTSLNNLHQVPTSHEGTGKKKVMLANGFVPGLTQFAQAKLQPGEIVKNHVHKDMWEVFLIEKGSCKFTVSQNEYDIEKGACITIEPGEHHGVINTGEGELTMTYFGITREQYP